MQASSFSFRFSHGIPPTHDSGNERNERGRKGKEPPRPDSKKARVSSLRRLSRSAQALVELNTSSPDSEPLHGFIRSIHANPGKAGPSQVVTLRFLIKMLSANPGYAVSFGEIIESVSIFRRAYRLIEKSNYSIDDRIVLQKYLAGIEPPALPRPVSVSETLRCLLKILECQCGALIPIPACDVGLSVIGVLMDSAVAQPPDSKPVARPVPHNIGVVSSDQEAPLSPTSPDTTLLPLGKSESCPVVTPVTVSGVPVTAPVLPEGIRSVADPLQVLSSPRPEVVIPALSPDTPIHLAQSEYLREVFFKVGPKNFPMSHSSSVPVLVV